MGGHSIGPATADDVSGLSGLLRSYSASEGVDVRLQGLIGRADHCIAVAHIDAELVGYAWVQDYGPHLRSGHSTARLHDLFVVEARRLHGVGSSLFAAAREWSRLRGVRWLEWQSSPSAVAFYERLGLHGDPCPQPDHPFFEIEF